MTPVSASYQECLHPEDRLISLAVRGYRTADENQELRSLAYLLGEQSCLDAARRNQVVPLVANALCNIQLETEHGLWDTVLTRNSERMHRQLELLISATEALEREGYRTSIIENGGTMLDSVMPAAAFSAGDMDILIEGPGWRPVDFAFASAGMQYKGRGRQITTRREYSLSTSCGEIWLSATFVPFERAWLPLIYDDHTPAWLRRCVPSKKFDELHVLHPVDALALVTIHASLHSYVRAPGIRLFTDIDWLVRENRIDWDQYLIETRRLGFATRAFVALAMSSFLLSTPIPAHVLTALSPREQRCSAILSLLARNGIFVHDKTKLGKYESIKLDGLLEDHGQYVWIKNVLLPPEDWMRGRSGLTSADSSAPILLLHLKRYWNALSQWKPA